MVFNYNFAKKFTIWDKTFDTYKTDDKIEKKKTIIKNKYFRIGLLVLFLGGFYLIYIYIYIMKTNFSKAFVTKIYDGDTITCDINGGFEIYLKDQKIRLYGIDTPEIRGPKKEQGIISRDKLREKILNREIILESIDCKKCKYGRWLCNVYYDNVNINQWLIDNNLAKKYIL